MPRREENSAQTNSKQGNMWWIPLIIGFMMLFIPGGLYASPVMFLIAIIMRRRKSKSPETSPNSPLPLINIKPKPHS